jgi:pyochelin biosynthesis protein PchC
MSDVFVITSRGFGTLSTTTSDSKLWLRNFHPAVEPVARLVCLPHAGGSASAYFALSAALAPTVETLAVQYPGRQDRRLDPCVESVPELAEAICTALLEWPDWRDLTERPLALFGHSMGAAVGFELARQLERRAGRPPVRLFASGRRAPSSIRSEKVHTLDDAGLVRELVALDGTDPALLDEEMLRLILPALRSDYRAIETYRCTADTTVSCPITVLTGDRDPRTTEAEAHAWQAHTTGGFALRTFSGGHFFLNDHRDAIARRITADLGITRP